MPLIQDEALLAEIARLEAENAALRARLVVTPEMVCIAVETWSNAAHDATAGEAMRAALEKALEP